MIELSWNNKLNIDYRYGEIKKEYEKKERQVSKKEGITRIRCDALTIHQERRYLSAMEYYQKWM